MLIKILLKGILKPIKTLMILNQMLPEVTTWEDAQKAAIRCETTLYKTQASGGTLELPTFSNTNIDTLAATAMQQQKKQIEALQKQLNKINVLGDEQEPTEDKLCYVASDQHGRPTQRTYGPTQNNTSVKWSDGVNNQNRYQNNNQQPRSRSREQYKTTPHNGYYQQDQQNPKTFSNQYQHPHNNQPPQRHQSPAARPSTPGPSSRSSSATRDFKNIQCYRCENYGHVAKECRTKDPRRLRRQGK